MGQEKQKPHRARKGVHRKVKRQEDLDKEPITFPTVTLTRGISHSEHRNSTLKYCEKKIVTAENLSTSLPMNWENREIRW